MRKAKARRSIQSALNGSGTYGSSTRSPRSPGTSSTTRRGSTSSPRASVGRLSIPGLSSPLRQAGSSIGGSKQKQIGTNVQPLEVDTLRPLVDLAYWSTFLEVRRDCAAAFATLSMNEANLQVLSQAGALGALLALIGVGNNRNDSQVHRNAATALSHLVKLNDIKFRLLKSPNGLKALFYLTRSPNVAVKRAAVKTLYNLAGLDEAKDVIVESGGIRNLLHLAEVKDERTKRQAVRVIRRCAELQRNKSRMMAENILKAIISLLSECPDPAMRKDLVETLNSLAAEEENANKLVEKGALLPLLQQTDLTVSSIETVLQCVKSIYLLVSNGAAVENISKIVEQGTVGTLVRCVFEDLPRFYSQRPLVGTASTTEKSRSNATVIDEILNGLETTGGIGNSISSRNTKRSSFSFQKQTNNNNSKSYHHGHAPPEVELMRTALHIFEKIAEQKRTRDTLVEWGVLDYLLEETICFSGDKRTRRTASTIIKLLSENGGESCVRHQDMVAKGTLSVLAQYLRGDDYELRCDAAASLSHMSVSDELKIPSGKMKRLSSYRLNDAFGRS